MPSAVYPEAMMCSVMAHDCCHVNRRLNALRSVGMETFEARSIPILIGSCRIHVINPQN